MTTNQPPRAKRFDWGKPIDWSRKTNIEQARRAMAALFGTEPEKIDDWSLGDFHGHASFYARKVWRETGNVL
jgi:hypothetical protein